jgi:hypothetical protein
MSDPVVAQQLRCPACAAPVEAPAGDVLRCPYCGTESRIGRPVAQRPVAAARAAPPRGGVTAAVATIAVVVLAFGFAAYGLLAGDSAQPSSPPPPHAVAAPTRSTPMVEAAPPPPPVAAPAIESGVADSREPSPRPDRFAAAPSENAIAVRWSAKVKKAAGRSKRGVKCEIVGHVDDDADAVRPLEVRCKGDVLYSSTQKFSGMANMSTGATVVTAKDGSPRWHLRYNDTGARSNRAQIRLDSAARIGRVWSDELPPWDVELAIDPEGVRLDPERGTP